MISPIAVEEVDNYLGDSKPAALQTASTRFEPFA